MFCPKCGATIVEGEQTCKECGLDLKSVVGAKTSGNVSDYKTQEQPYQIQQSNTKVIIWCLLAGVSLIIFLCAAHLVMSGGKEISGIESVGGRTLEEAYYKELGTVYAGIAWAIRGIGIFVSCVLAKFGFEK